jgi:hypothetical protein
MTVPSAALTTRVDSREELPSAVEAAVPVRILVVDAGIRGWSACLEYSTVPEVASKTTAPTEPPNAGPSKALSAAARAGSDGIGPVGDDSGANSGR